MIKEKVNEAKTADRKLSISNPGTSMLTTKIMSTFIKKALKPKVRIVKGIKII